MTIGLGCQTPARAANRHCSPAPGAGSDVIRRQMPPHPSSLMMQRARWVSAISRCLPAAAPRAAAGCCSSTRLRMPASASAHASAIAGLAPTMITSLLKEMLTVKAPAKMKVRAGRTECDNRRTMALAWLKVNHAGQARRLCQPYRQRRHQPRPMTARQLLFTLRGGQSRAEPWRPNGSQTV